MTTDSSETLCILFSIPQAKLDADLNQAAADSRAIAHRVHTHYAQPQWPVTPRHAALGFHLEMLLAFALWHNPNAPKEIALLHADWAAQQCCEESWAKDRFWRLCQPTRTTDRCKCRIIQRAPKRIVRP